MWVCALGPHCTHETTHSICVENILPRAAHGKYVHNLRNFISNAWAHKHYDSWCYSRGGSRCIVSLYHGYIASCRLLSCSKYYSITVNKVNRLLHTARMHRNPKRVGRAKLLVTIMRSTCVPCSIAMSIGVWFDRLNWQSMRQRRKELWQWWTRSPHCGSATTTSGAGSPGPVPDLFFFSILYFFKVP